MSIQEEKLKAIADAIREKDGTTELIPANDFPERIRAISSVPDGLRTITLAADPPDGGTVSGGGMASDGMTVIITTNALQGYKFENWVENGNIVSTETQYKFLVERDMDLKSVFSAKKNHELPEGFTEVEYIYVDDKYAANLYILTNYILTEQDILKVQYARREDDDYNSFMGYQYGSTAQQRTAFSVKNATDKNYPNAFCAMTSWNSYTYFKNLVYGNKFLFTINCPNKTITLNVGEQEESYSFTQMPNSYSKLRFLNDYNGGDSKYTRNVPTGYFYGCSILDSEGIVKTEFVPCVYDSGGYAGLYDTTAKRMYTASTTARSHIIAGPPV